MKFDLVQKDIHSKARLGVVHTHHGEIETPTFMPVGTRGAVKSLSPDQVLALDPKIILGNTYHLMLRPGKEIIKKAGGLHSFMRWPRPILTDSGGFQVFSLSAMNKVTHDGVHFRSHIDGSRHFLGPRESMEMQKVLGADIVMAFDECPAYPCTKPEMIASMERTHRWAKECRDYELSSHQNLFGIVQGGVFDDLRKESADLLSKLDFDGYAIGGVSVGEPAEKMYQAVDAAAPNLPENKPRYLMGVGTPRNIVEAVYRGIDLFDCVMPTRNARNATAFTWEGKISIKAARYADDFTPLDPQLDFECSRYSKAYVRHLFNVGEMAASIILTQQNIAFYLDFMRQLRQSIKEQSFDKFYERIRSLYPS
jgi:queuine tRNA-ribosyltransferase